MNAIEFNNVSKKFKKGEDFDSLRDFIPNITRKLFLKNKAKDENTLEEKEFWALKDINFHVKKGEALGIIGPNGAGKSTILKILSKILKPTSGEMKINGKLSALIEVGAGFHPDLTGRENVYLSGAIVGMRRKEIDRKFDSIVEFSELKDFIDTPVKKYSSGMYVRLGFSVAAHLDPEVLLIDEVLAVGDMSFQAKCLDKIREFVDGGKTIIFISHQLHQVEKLCDRVILLIGGKAVFEGDPNEAIDIYRSKVTIHAKNNKEKNGTGEIVTKNVELLDGDRKMRNEFNTGEPVTLRVSYEAKERIQNPIFSIGIHSFDNIIVSHMRTDADDVPIGFIEGRGHIDLNISTLNLLPNTYHFSVNILKEDGIGVFDAQPVARQFLIKGGHKVYGLCYLKHQWGNKTAISIKE